MSMYRTPSFGSVSLSRERLSHSATPTSRRDSDSRVTAADAMTSHSSHLSNSGGKYESRMRPVSSTGQLERGGSVTRTRDTTGSSAGGASTYIPLSQRTGGYLRPVSRALLRSTSSTSSTDETAAPPTTPPTLNNGDIMTTVSVEWLTSHARGQSPTGRQVATVVKMHPAPWSLTVVRCVSLLVVHDVLKCLLFRALSVYCHS